MDLYVKFTLICFCNALYFRDHVQWTEEDKENAQQKAKENAFIQIPLEEQGKNLFLQKYFLS